MAEIGTDLKKAQRLLENGELVAIPTETVYGLAANAFNTKAVASIFEAKNRPHFDPLIVHLYDDKQLLDLCADVPAWFEKLYQAFSPGPVTYIIQKKSNLPDLVTAGNDTVGVRFPRHPLTRELLFESQMPLAAPSANPFGYVSPTTARHVADQLGDKIPYILDGGPCEVGIESTIIDLSTNEPRILRLGGLAREEIEEITGPIEISARSSSNPKAPGMLSSHYAPKRRLILGNIKELLKKYGNHRVGTLTFSESVSGVPRENQRILSPRQDLKEAAANLFKSMRELDNVEVDYILAERFPDQGLGQAINDRLNRAAF